MMSENTNNTIQYHIVVACGTAIATSTHVAIKIKEQLAERGLKITTTQCRVTEVPSYSDGSHLVVSTAQIPYDINVPVVNGIAFLTGIGEKEVLDKIEEILRSV
jgi:PTS system galactitol-specific IIB component